MGEVSCAHKPKGELRQKTDAHVRFLLPILLTTQLGLRYHICGLHFKFQNDRTKLRSLMWTNGNVNTDEHTDKQIDRETNRHTLK